MTTRTAGAASPSWLRTIAAAAQRSRWITLIQACGLTADEAALVLASDSFGPLSSALRRAEAYGLTPEQLLPRLIETRPLEDADDIGAVLHHRISTATTHRQQAPNAVEPDLIVGLIPTATGPMSAEMRAALQQRQQLIQRRVTDVLRSALAAEEPWIRHLGPPPRDVAQRRIWARHAATVAAYRDRYSITAPVPLGPSPHPDGRRTDASVADNAIRHALAISQASRLRPPALVRRRSAERASHFPSM